MRVARVHARMRRLPLGETIMSTGDMHNFGSGAEPTKSCPFCGEAVKLDAKKCKHCGEIIDVVMRELQSMKESKRDAAAGGGSAPIIISNNNNNSASSSSSAAATAAVAAPIAPIAPIAPSPILVVNTKPEGSIFWLIVWSCFYVVPGIIYYNMRRWPWQS